MSVNKEKRFDIHGSVHRRWLSRNTNKMQLCNRIYYFKVYWRLNMFRAAHRSSSGALNCLYSLWFIYPCGDRPLPRLSLGNGRSPHGYINQRLQIQLKLLMMSGVSLETCWAFNKLWNNKFYYKAASCWYLYWVIYNAGGQLTENRGRTVFFLFVVVTSYWTAGHSNCSDHFWKIFRTRILPDLLPLLCNCGFLSVTQFFNP